MSQNTIDTSKQMNKEQSDELLRRLICGDEKNLQVVHIGKDLILSRYYNGQLWLNRKDGEGMELHEDEFYELLDKYYKEKF